MGAQQTFLLQRLKRLGYIPDEEGPYPTLPKDTPKEGGNLKGLSFFRRQRVQPGGDKQLNGQRDAGLLTLFGDHGQYWSLFEWEYDGHTKAIGEDQEYKCLDEWRRWHRAGPEAWALR